MCTHGARRTFSEGPSQAAARMDGLTRPESMWAQQSEYDKRPPHLLKPSRSSQQISPAQSDAVDVALSTPLASTRQKGMQAHTRAATLHRPPAKEIDSMVLERDRGSHFTERNVAVEWSNGTPTGHQQTSSDRPWLIINLCESDTVDVIEIIHFPRLKSKSFFLYLKGGPWRYQGWILMCVCVCVCAPS